MGLLQEPHFENDWTRSTDSFVLWLLVGFKPWKAWAEDWTEGRVPSGYLSLLLPSLGHHGLSAATPLMSHHQ